MSSSKARDAEGIVTLTADDARQIAHFLSLLLGRPESASGQEDEGERGEDAGRARLVARAKAVLMERERRTRLFSPVLFGEIAWEMLLWLYVTEDQGERQTIGRLASLVGAPHTTALRWIGYLEKEALIEKVPHPNDRRTVFVRLLEEGRTRLDRWFDTLARPIVQD